MPSSFSSEKPLSRRGRPVRGSISSSLYPFISMRIFSASASSSMRLSVPSGSRGGSS